MRQRGTRTHCAECGDKLDASNCYRHPAGGWRTRCKRWRRSGGTSSARRCSWCGRRSCQLFAISVARLAPLRVVSQFFAPLPTMIRRAAAVAGSSAATAERDCGRFGTILRGFVAQRRTSSCRRTTRPRGRPKPRAPLDLVSPLCVLGTGRVLGRAGQLLSLLGSAGQPQRQSHYPTWSGTLPPRCGCHSSRRR